MPSSEIIDHIKGTSTLAVFIKATAKDDTVLAITNDSRARTIDGVTYEPVPVVPTQVQSSEDMKADNAELSVPLGGEISATKLRAGKWLGAKIEYAVYNFEDFSMGPLFKKLGYLGEITLGRLVATPELLSLIGLLDRPTTRQALETCDVIRFGDTRCKKETSGNTEDGYRIRTTAQVASVTNLQQFTVSYTQSIKPSNGGITIAPDGFFRNGTILFTSGENDGLETLVMANTGNQIKLWRPAFYDITAGDLVTVEAGCDRTIAACSDKFNNGANFRGFWQLLGREKMFKMLDE